MSTVGNDWQEFIRAFSGHCFEYMVVGGVAVDAHVHVRYTKDDVWFRATEQNAEASHDFGFATLDVAPSEFCKARAIFVIGAEPNKIELINFGDGVEFEECFRLGIEVSLGDAVASVIGLDDLLASKRAVGRLQDLVDTESLNNGSSGQVNAEN